MSIGRRGVGVAGPDKRAREQFHALPRAEHGELRYHVECVRGGARVRGGDSEG